MKVSHFRVRNNLCEKCSLALRRFGGGMDDHAKLTSRIVLPVVPGELDPATVMTEDADYRVL